MPALSSSFGIVAARFGDWIGAGGPARGGSLLTCGYFVTWIQKVRSGQRGDPGFARQRQRGNGNLLVKL
jgi:hypothetical protein